MEFSKFDVRGKAETGRAFPILHPETLEPIVEDDKEAKFIIRGAASPTVQEAYRVMLAQALQDQSEGDRPFTFEALHQSTIKSALPLLAGFENVELNGVPVSMENAEEFLNLTFPRMVQNEQGKYEVANKTFAMQVLERSKELDATLGNV